MHLKMAQAPLAVIPMMAMVVAAVVVVTLAVRDAADVVGVEDVADDPGEKGYASPATTATSSSLIPYSAYTHAVGLLSVPSIWACSAWACYTAARVFRTDQYLHLMLFCARWAIMLLLLWTCITALGQQGRQHIAIADQLYEQGVVSVQGRDMVHAWTVPSIPFYATEFLLESEQRDILYMAVQAFRARAVLACYAHMADSLHRRSHMEGLSISEVRGDIDDIVDRCCCARPGRITNYDAKSLDHAQQDPEFSILIQSSEKSSMALNERVYNAALPDLIEQLYTANAIDSILRADAYRLVAAQRIDSPWELFEFAYDHLGQRPRLRERIAKQAVQIQELEHIGAISTDQAQQLRDTLKLFMASRVFDLVTTSTKHVSIEHEIGSDVEAHLRGVLSSLKSLSEEFDFADVKMAFIEDRNGQTLKIAFNVDGRPQQFKIPIDDIPEDERIVPRDPRRMLIDQLNRLLCDRSASVRIVEVSLYDRMDGSIERTALCLVTGEVAAILYPGSYIERMFDQAECGK